MAALFDLVAMTVSSAPGTGASISLGNAATINGVTYLSFTTAGTPAGTSIAYSILDTGASEIGTATFLSSGPLLSARTPTKSTNANAAINASSAAIILCSPRAEDIISTDLVQTFTAAQQLQARANIGVYVSPDVQLTDLNTLVTGGIFFIEANCTNQPVAATQYYLLVQKYPLSANFVQQTAWDITPGGGMWTRGQFSGAWTAWVRVMVGANNLSEVTNAQTALGNIGGISFAVTQGTNATQQGQARLNSGAVATGFVNKLRNSSMTAWFHGSASRAITTAGGWGAEGLYVVPTGASVTIAQNANGLSNPLTFNSQLITGATSVTDVTVRFVVESYDAAPLVGQQVTFQVPVLNSTGATITPTITVKHGAAQDATYTSIDVNAVNLQSIANGATGVLAYSWTVAAGSANGLSINIDFGNNFSTTGKSIQIGGGFDLRATPGVATGLVSTPQVPEIRSVADDILWNCRYFEASYSNGVAPGTVTELGRSFIEVAPAGTANIAAGVSASFRMQKRAVPTLTTYSTISGAAGKATDVSSVDVVPTLNVADTGFSWLATQSASTSSLVLRCQWTADAALIGG